MMFNEYKNCMVNRESIGTLYRVTAKNKITEGHFDFFKKTVQSTGYFDRAAVAAATSGQTNDEHRDR